MTGVMEYFDEKGIEHSDERDHGAMWLQGSWSIVMKVVMDHCEDKCPGTL